MSGLQFFLSFYVDLSNWCIGTGRLPESDVLHTMLLELKPFHKSVCIWLMHSIFAIDVFTEVGSIVALCFFLFYVN